MRQIISTYVVQYP